MGEIIVQDKVGERDRILRLKGALTIEMALKLKGVILQALDEACPVELDMSDAQSIDLACIQRLCSAHRSFHRSGRGITLIGDIPEGVRAVFSALAISPETCDSPYAPECMLGKGGDHE